MARAPLPETSTDRSWRLTPNYWKFTGYEVGHLSLEERCRLRGMIEMDLSVSEIARRMDRHRSTIQRELERNRCADGYRPDSAGRCAWARKLRGSKIERLTLLRDHVEDRLAMGGSGDRGRFAAA